MEDVAATPSPHLVTKRVWQHSMSVAAGQGSPIASDADTVYLSSQDSVCAVRLADGKDRWCTGSAATSVALAGNIVATVESDGIIRGRDKKNGALAWQAVITPAVGSPAPLNSNEPALEQAVWSTGQTFLGVRSTSPAPTTTTIMGELSASGRQLWAWSGRGNVDAPPLVSSPYAVVNIYEASATAHNELLKLDSQGGVIGPISEGAFPIAFRLPKLYSRICCNRPFNSYAPDIQITVADVRPGVTSIDWRYQPDYEENSKLPAGTNGTNSISKTVGIEGPYLYGSVFEHVYRYDLAGPEGQQPILLSDQGHFVAGPYAERVYVGRPDGVWSVHFNGRFVYQRLVIPCRLPTVLAGMEFADRIGYAALTDGTMLAFSTDTGEQLVRVKSSCSNVAGIFITKTRVIYACSAPTPLAIALPRVQAPSL